jgi:hypothetical protein
MKSKLKTITESQKIEMASSAECQMDIESEFYAMHGL